MDQTPPQESPSSSHSARWFGLLLLAILAGALLVDLTGSSRVPLWDGDEPRYAQCSREMLQSGDWVVPTFLGQWRLEKPPMIYWCQAICMTVLGDTAFAARLPSTIAEVSAVLLLALVVKKAVSPKHALFTALIFATAGLSIAAAKMCLTDAVLMFFILTGQCCIARFYSDHLTGRKSSWLLAMLLWVSIGLAGLTKGPQAIGMDVMTLLVLLVLDVREYRNPRAWFAALTWWKRLRPISGVILLAAVTAPWMIMIHHRAPDFLDQLLHKAKMHTATSMEGHGEPPGYHAILIFGTYFPWSLLLPAAIAIAFRSRANPAVRFAIAAAFGPWLLMECVWTKLPFYVYPAFPALAFLTADAIIRCAAGEFRDFATRGFRIAVVIWTLVVLGIATGPWLLLKVDHGQKLPIPGIAAFYVMGLFYAGVVLLRWYQQRVERAAVVMGVGMIIMLTIMYGTILPHLKFLQLSERLVADLIPVQGIGKDVPVAMISNPNLRQGYREQSLPFYQGGGAREIEVNTLLHRAPADWPKLMVIDERIWLALPASAQNQFRVVASEWGIDYATGSKPMTVLVAEKQTP